VAGARTAMETIIAGVRQAFALTGSKSIEELRRKPRVVIGELRDWLDALV
jgi:isopentenyl-diphosphate delta-isomerase